MGYANTTIWKATYRGKSTQATRNIRQNQKHRNPEPPETKPANARNKEARITHRKWKHIIRLQHTHNRIRAEGAREIHRILTRRRTSAEQDNWTQDQKRA